jgi:hypothetical protein
MNLLGRIVLVVCLVSLGACVKPTPYQPRTDGYGYDSIQLEPNRYRVAFYGNTATTRETVETYLMYYAAQLTLEVGGDHFQVVDRELATDATAYTNYAPYYGSSLFFGYGTGGYYRPYTGPYYGATLGVGRTRVTEKYDGIMEILAFRGPKPPDDPESYDAREVIAHLDPLIRYPAP